MLAQPLIVGTVAVAQALDLNQIGNHFLPA
jgi:hypothetical protein